MRRTPVSYITATWRCTLPIDIDGNQGVGFDLEDGRVIRLYLDRKSVESLCMTLKENYFSTTSQSEALDGNPIVEVSSIPETEKV